MSKEDYETVLQNTLRHLKKRNLSRHQLSVLLTGYMVAMENFADDKAGMKEVHDNAKVHTGIRSKDLTPAQKGPP